jgi:hypothetical protein
VKRRYKFLIWLLPIWIFGGIFPVWMLIPDPHLASPNVEGLAKGLLLVAIIVGGLIWVVWPSKNSN